MEKKKALGTIDRIVNTQVFLKGYVPILNILP